MVSRGIRPAQSAISPGTTPRDGSSGVVGTLWTGAAGFGVGEHEVGEGAADIDPDQPHPRPTLECVFYFTINAAKTTQARMP